MFETHVLNEKGMEEVKLLKAIMGGTLERLLPHLPDTRETSIFKTKIEEAMFFGVKAIASKDGNYKEIVKYVEDKNEPSK